MTRFVTGTAFALAVILACGPGANALESRLFQPPPAGSYTLPPIDRVADHALLDPAGRTVPLLDLAPDQVALVAFVYRACADACPRALAMLCNIDRRRAADAALAARIRLVSVSFDPVHDTPTQMGQLARELGAREGWRFLTAADEAAITPVLADFGQDALRAAVTDGPAIRHVLKVFLVDARGDVRNIYSTGFLDEDLIWSDVATLLGKR